VRLRLTFLILLTAGLAPAQVDPAQQMLRGPLNFSSRATTRGHRRVSKLLKLHPEAAAVRSNLGAALSHEGHYSEAIREYTLA